jgi:hypothetical protein
MQMKTGKNQGHGKKAGSIPFFLAVLPGVEALLAGWVIRSTTDLAGQCT